MECQNKRFWRCFSSGWPFVALLKSPNALKMGSFGTKNGSKMDQKCVFPKILLDYLGCTNKWNEPILGPYWAILAPLKAQKGLENGPNGDDKWLKDRSKPRFPNMIPVHLWCPNG